VTVPARIGRYEVEFVLGEGSTGRVLVARDPVLGRQVVIKVVRDDLGLTPELEARLTDRIRQEARATAALSHPALVGLHDMGDDESVGLYVVFEFIKAPTLRERLSAGPLPPGEVAQVAKAVGAALAHGHAAGVVHRDVRPESILLAPGGVRLTEPGFASIARADPTLRQAMPALKDGFLPMYAAPESLASDQHGPHADQFALAATLYEALTGKRAFGDGEATAVAARVMAGVAAAPSAALPRLRSFPNLDTIFRRAFARDPRKRFSSCDVLGNVLATEIDRVDASRLPPGSVSSIVPRATRRWQNAAAGAAVLVILTLIVMGRQRPRPTEGVSLSTVASAFTAAVSAPRAPPPPRRVHAPETAASTSRGLGSESTVPAAVNASALAATTSDAAAPEASERPDLAIPRPVAPPGDAVQQR
jgi:serine/threonine protein kinase